MLSVDHKQTDDYMLTTVDNPFNPYTQFDEWYAYDIQKGHCSCALLARIVVSSNDLPESDEDDAIKQAIDDIVKMNPSLYTKYYK